MIFYAAVFVEVCGKNEGNASGRDCDSEAIVSTKP